MPCSFGKTLLALSSVFLSLAAAQFSSKPPTIPPNTAIQQAEKVSTGNPAKCPSGTKYFPQVLDHTTFNGNYSDPSAIFLQQYQINDTYYKPGGPIVFYQGTESVMACIEYQIMPEWAQELNALLVNIEHRYFGLSCPYGLNYTDYSTWNSTLMKPLTLENVLFDGRSLLTWIKTVAYPSAKNSKVIVGSGSYGGILASLYRIHYPDDIYAAVVASPVTKGLISDPKDPLTYGWGDWSSMVYSDYSARAASIIKQGMNDIRAQLTHGNFTGLQEQLHLCAQPNSNTNADDLLREILAAYVVSAQMDYAWNDHPFQRIINATLSAVDPVAAVGAAVVINNAWNGNKCQNVAPLYAAGGPFLWLRCTQIPYPNPAAREGTIWGPLLPDTTVEHILDPFCQASFGFKSIDGGTLLVQRLELDQSTIENTTRLLVYEGLLDPTTAYGPYSWNPGPSRNDSRIMFVSQAAHGEVFFPPAPTDSDGLVEARVYILNSLKEWFA